jgi:hypothetical protein
LSIPYRAGRALPTRPASREDVLLTLNGNTRTATTWSAAFRPARGTEVVSPDRRGQLEKKVSIEEREKVPSDEPQLVRNKLQNDRP